MNKTLRQELIKIAKERILTVDSSRDYNHERNQRLIFFPWRFLLIPDVMFYSCLFFKLYKILLALQTNIQRWEDVDLKNVTPHLKAVYLLFLLAL